MYTRLSCGVGKIRVSSYYMGSCNSYTRLPGYVTLHLFTRTLSMISRDLIKEEKLLIYIDDFIFLAKGNSGLNIGGCYNRAIRTRFNWKKCTFLESEEEFIGHVITNGNVRPTPEKMVAVSESLRCGARIGKRTLYNEATYPDAFLLRN